jgi:hypothetical protein
VLKLNRAAVRDAVLEIEASDLSAKDFAVQCLGLTVANEFHRAAVPGQ